MNTPTETKQGVWNEKTQSYIKPSGTVKHADKLAEALRSAERELEEGVMSGVVAQHIRATLSAYEAAHLNK